MAETHLTELDIAIEARVAVIAEAAARATPHGRALHDWTLATRNVHASRAGEVAALVSGGDDEIDRLIAAGQSEEALREVDRVTDKIRYGGFASSKAEPLQQEVWRRELDLFGWAPEIGALFNNLGGLIRQGQKITWLDWWTISVDGTDHSHEQIRARGRTAGRPIPTRAQIVKEAETDLETRETLRRIDAR